SLPWSTSLTAVLAGLWLLAFIPTLDLPVLKRVLLSPAGRIPVVLVMLGAIGMLWADVSWAERLNGVGSFFKLLFIPLLLHQFYRSDSGWRVLTGFVGSCVLLLILSWSFWAYGIPTGSPSAPAASPGVPVKDYISQSGMFTICVFVILRSAREKWRVTRRGLALALVVLAGVFFADILYVATSRTFLIVIPVLLVVFGYQTFRWKGVIFFLVGFLGLAFVAWPSSSFLRQRVTSFFGDLSSYQPSANPTPSGERVEFWRKSLGFIREAPVFGHGTGSIRDQFGRSAAGQSGMAAEIAANPHNQTLAVGIQLGLVGIAVLLAMWIAHLALFRSDSFAAWVGLVVVVQNIAGSLFNSHLFDFTQGWAYVVGVGIAGGVVLRESSALSEKLSAWSCGRPID